MLHLWQFVYTNANTDVYFDIPDLESWGTELHTASEFMKKHTVQLLKEAENLL